MTTNDGDGPKPPRPNLVLLDSTSFYGGTGGTGSTASGSTFYSPGSTATNILEIESWGEPPVKTVPLRNYVSIDPANIVCPHCGGPLRSDLTGQWTGPNRVQVDGFGDCPDPTCPGKRRPGEAPLIYRNEENAEGILESGVYEFIADDSDEPEDPDLNDPDCWGD